MFEFQLVLTIARLIGTKEPGWKGRPMRCLRALLGWDVHLVTA